MSIVESAGGVDPGLLKWGGYALAGLGALAVGWAHLAPGPLPALAAILAALASFAVALVSPAVFEVAGALAVAWYVVNLCSAAPIT